MKNDDVKENLMQAFSTNRELIVDIFIPPDEFLLYYNGTANDVFCKSRDGRTISFPVKIIHPYISHSGVKGSFVIAFNKDNKFHSIRKLE